MKIQGKDFLNADDNKKEIIINTIIELETRNSFSKGCLIEVIKYQQEKIVMFDNYMSNVLNRVKSLY